MTDTLSDRIHEREVPSSFPSPFSKDSYDLLEVIYPVDVREKLQEVVDEIERRLSHEDYEIMVEILKSKMGEKLMELPYKTYEDPKLMSNSPEDKTQEGRMVSSSRSTSPSLSKAVEGVTNPQDTDICENCGHPKEKHFNNRMFHGLCFAGKCPCMTFHEKGAEA